MKRLDGIYPLWKAKDTTGQVAGVGFTKDGEMKPMSPDNFVVELLPIQQNQQEKQTKWWRGLWK